MQTTISAPYAKVGALSDREVADSGSLAHRFYAELERATRDLKHIGPAVVIWGSARLKEGTPEFDATEDVAYQLSKLGYAIITGGGPGVMLAGNRGAQRGGSVSVGLNLTLEHENDGVGNGAQDVVLKFDNFGPRNEVFMRYGSIAMVVMPGGFGTGYELLMALTHIQCKKADRRPILLVEDDPNRPFWGWVNVMCQAMQARGYISDTDDQLFQVTPAEKVADVVSAFGACLK